MDATIAQVNALGRTAAVLDPRIAKMPMTDAALAAIEPPTTDKGSNDCNHKEDRMNSYEIRAKDSNGAVNEWMGQNRRKMQARARDIAVSGGPYDTVTLYRYAGAGVPLIPLTGWARNRDTGRMGRVVV